MTAHIISARPGKLTSFHVEDGTAFVRTVADVEPVLEHAKALHNEGRHTNAIGDHHIGRIPFAALQEWCQRKGICFDHAMQDIRVLEEFLRDPDNSMFRVHKGAI